MNRLMRNIPTPILLLAGALIALFVFLAWMTPAAAGWCAHWGTRTFCRAGAFEGDAFSIITGRSCVQRRYCRHWVRDHDYDYRWRDERRRERVYGYERRHDDDDRYPRYGRHERRCWPMVTVKGTEAMTENGALISAKRAWRAWVRADFGERYQELDAAKHAEYRCWRSSTNESAIGRAGEFLTGQYRKRCSVRAVPCLDGWQRLEGDKDDRE